MTISTQSLEKYMQHIRGNYAGWLGDSTDIKMQMIVRFNESVRVEYARKFVKVIAGDSVHSFICLADDGKFKEGDILMAASWKAPAKNFSRGNINDETYSRIRWTGAM